MVVSSSPATVTAPAVTGGDDRDTKIVADGELNNDNQHPDDDDKAASDSIVSNHDHYGGGGIVICTAVLKPPLCQLQIPSDGTNDGSNNNNNEETTTMISYELKQPAWECTFSKDGTYLAVCYGAPNPCIRIYHYCCNNNINTSSTKNNNNESSDQQSNYDTTQSQSTWKNTNSNSNLRSAIAQQQNNNNNRIHNSKTTTTSYSWQLQYTLNDTENQQQIQNRTIRSIDFAPITNPYILASASFDGTVAIWEQQQHVTATLPNTNNDSSNNRNDNNNQNQNKIRYTWECTTQLEGHENEVKCVRWNATGTLLASCGRDKTIWIWEAYLPGTMGGGPVLSKEIFASNNTRTAQSTSLSSTNFECIAVLNGHEGDVKCIQFANSHNQFGDGNEIVISASYDETIRIWAEEDGDWYCAMSLSSIHTSTIWTLSVAPSATRFISGSDDHSLAIYKCFTPEELHQRDSKDGVTNAMKRRKATWECVGTLPDAHTSTIYCVDYAPTRASHGRIISCGADNRIQIYREVPTSTMEQPLFIIDTYVTVPNGGDVNCVKWHPHDGSIFVSTSDDGSVRIWNYTF